MCLYRLATAEAHVSASGPLRRSHTKYSRLDSATELLCSKLHTLQESVDRLQTSPRRHGEPQSIAAREKSISQARTSNHRSPAETAPATESSSEFLQIPTQRTTADAVLTWEIFERRYPPSALIGVHFTRVSRLQDRESAPSDDTFTVHRGTLAPREEQLPALIESFLQNVHTKNPVLDTDQLVRQARMISSDGLSWDAWSCLVLLAAALGRIAKPFDMTTALSTSPSADDTLRNARPIEQANTLEELDEAEAYFVLACRRLGGLKHSLLSSQCFFFAGVYLMYTLRPLLSWQYFTQASTLLRLYMNTAYQLGPSGLRHAGVNSQHRTTKRLEECMFWSCFKSEIEFRVELPLPQSELTSCHHPDMQMFPSPRSPARLDELDDTALNHLDAGESSASILMREPSVVSFASSETISSRQRVARLCNEEESWYYYLTEIALRRIGNRIINTFFRKEPAAWLDVTPLLRIALEFDTQVSAWSANLPDAMKQWETDYAIRRPEPAFLPDGRGSHVLHELSWALENRLLEVRSWLYQPFMYWLIHSHNASAIADGSRDDFIAAATAKGLGAEDATALHHFVVSGLECNLKILDLRSLRHRHHGVWYDMRGTMCAALVLLAVVKSGNEAWIPGGAAVLFGPYIHGATDQCPIAGKLGQVMAAYDFWSAESSDLKRHRDVLEEVAHMVQPSRRA
ncbi:hypothetical protein LTR86_011048 [Recurvomyces mirabilis]|nr:hypothetical protein LTR86_011048 [Recurvomyces mirabilis]